MSDHLEDVTLDEVLETVEDLQGQGIGTVGGALDRLGTASFLPLILLIALIVVTPLSGIPGLSGFSGVTIALIAGQLLIGRDSLWLPDVILRRRIPEDRFEKALVQIQKPLGLIQDHTKERMTFLAKGPAAQALLIICMSCGLAMPFLEVVPATSSMLAGAITLLTVAIISRDGLFAITGLLSLAIALTVLFYLIRSIYGIF